MQTAINRVEDAITELRQGKMLILVDHPERENEGDIIFPAEKITPEITNFMIRHCSGILCLSMTPPQIKKLGLSLMVPAHENTSSRGTPFTISIEARHGVTTGVSAADRATTILTAIDDHATPHDLVKPGHIFPLEAKKNGVLERAGHTEGAVDMMRLAGFKPAAVLCEVMNPDGTMTCGAELKKFAKQHQLKILAIDDLITYRLNHENLIQDEVSAKLPIQSHGNFNISIIKEKITQHEHVVLTKKQKNAKTPVLVRIHSCCVTGDLFGSQRCDCHQQLHYSLERIGDEGGVLIYLNQEGRGIGLFNKIKAYALQERRGFDTVEANHYLGMPADARSYYLAANILRNRGIDQVRLLTNNPAKITGLKNHGIMNVVREPIPVFNNEYNKKYLQTKKIKLNHFIHMD